MIATCMPCLGAALVAQRVGWWEDTCCSCPRTPPPPHYFRRMVCELWPFYVLIGVYILIIPSLLAPDGPKDDPKENVSPGLVAWGNA